MIHTQNEEVKSLQGEYNAATSLAGTWLMLQTKDWWLGRMAEAIACGLKASTYREQLKPGVTFKCLYANAAQMYSTELSTAGFRAEKWECS